MTSPTVPEQQQRSILLPVSLATRTDLSRVIRELETVDNFLQQGAIRQPGSPMQLPKTSKVFEELVNGSKLNMLQAEDRQYLRTSLEWMRDQSPTLHVAFSTDPSPLFIERLITWLRQNISPFVLVRIGLHPNIGAGCVVRSTNKYFDFSLRQRFLAQRGLLLEELGVPVLASTSATVPPAPPPVPETPPTPVATTPPPPQAPAPPTITAPAPTAPPVPAVAGPNEVALDSGVMLSTDPNAGMEPSDGAAK